MYRGYHPVEAYYTPDMLDQYVKDLLDDDLPVITVRSRRKVYKMYNIAAAYDTETTNFFLGRWMAFTYAWMISINGRVMLGRTWEEWDEFNDRVLSALNVSEYLRLPMYVHNLPFEFQFMYKRLGWLEVFAKQSRNPLRALSSNGIEYRCSLQLTLKPLSMLECYKYKTTEDTGRNISKQIGSLDYSKIRHSETPLTKQEIRYCIYDVISLASYIQEQIEYEGSVDKIPLTCVGYVRRDMSAACLNSGDKKQDEAYRKLMSSLIIDTVREYDLFKDVIGGGDVGVNAAWSFQTLKKVGSFDLASAHPAHQVMNVFPMSHIKFINPTKKEFEQMIKDGQLMALRVVFLNLRPKYQTWEDKKTGKIITGVFEHPLHVSKCDFCNRNHEEVNGRVVTADMVITAMTNLDWLTMSEKYDWDNYDIIECGTWYADYLPTPFISRVLDYYAKKTELKGVKGKEFEYSMSKINICAIFGCTAMDPVHEAQTFNESIGCWIEDIDDNYDETLTVAQNEDEQEYSRESHIMEELKKFNASFSRFVYPWWAVFTTAGTRRTLQIGISRSAGDYVYSDTDCRKVKNPESHLNEVAEENKIIEQKMKKAMKHHGFKQDRWKPKTAPVYNKDGSVKKPSIVKPLGFWEYEGYYQKFKALRSKCYMFKKKGKITCTVAGLSKTMGSRYLQSHGDQFGDHFAIFDKNLEIPEEYSGRLTHLYCDEEIGGQITDYLGNVGTYHEYSWVVLYPAKYRANMDDDMIEYFQNSRYYVDESAFSIRD